MNCRSDCPQGDCANCFGLPRPRPRPTSRCVPADCAQASGCAHAAASPARPNDFDASGCKTSDGWCPMFIDKRGLALTVPQ